MRLSLAIALSALRHVAAFLRELAAAWNVPGRWRWRSLKEADRAVAKADEAERAGKKEGK